MNIPLRCEKLVHSSGYKRILAVGGGLRRSFRTKGGKKRLFAAFLDILIVVKCVEILYTIQDFILTSC